MGRSVSDVEGSVRALADGPHRRTWRNVFWLPHQILAFEIRVSEGYGMRFQCDTKVGKDTGWTFRGFVEPAMDGKDGHAAKWRH